MNGKLLKGNSRGRELLLNLFNQILTERRPKIDKSKMLDEEIDQILRMIPCQG